MVDHYLCLRSIYPPIFASAPIDAKAAIMVDTDTGQIIYEQNAQQQLPVASISKLLTVAVIHDELQNHIINDYTKVKVTPDIAAISNDPSYSSVGLVSGQSYPVIELLNAAMVKSADGATIALATAAGNSPDEFVLKMDQKAHEIGLHKASIVNPTGLTNHEMKNLRSNNFPDNAENAMNAQDVAVLTRYLVQTYPQILQVSAQKKVNILISKHNVKSVDNLNKMLPGDQFTVPGVKITGLKTGTSDKAGACFVSTGIYQKHHIITVVLHANGQNHDNRFVQTQKLYRMLKNRYYLQKINLPNNIVKTKVAHGSRSMITTKPSTLTVWRAEKLTSYTVSQNFDNRLTNHTSTLQAPIKIGQRIGSIRLTSSKLKTITNEPLTYPLYSNETVTKGTLLERLFSKWTNLFKNSHRAFIQRFVGIRHYKSMISGSKSMAFKNLKRSSVLMKMVWVFSFGWKVWIGSSTMSLSKYTFTLWSLLFNRPNGETIPGSRPNSSSRCSGRAMETRLAPVMSINSWKSIRFLSSMITM